MLFKKVPVLYWHYWLFLWLLMIYTVWYCMNWTPELATLYHWPMPIANLIRFNWVCENFSHLLFVRWEKFSQIWDRKKFFTKFSVLNHEKFWKMRKIFCSNSNYIFLIILLIIYIKPMHKTFNVILRKSYLYISAKELIKKIKLVQFKSPL